MTHHSLAQLSDPVIFRYGMAEHSVFPLRDIVEPRRQRNISDRQLRAVAARLLRSTNSQDNVPVIISGAVQQEKSVIAVGHVLRKTEAKVTALVDTALNAESAVTVFLVNDTYLGEVVSCDPDGTNFAIEVLLIQYKRNRRNADHESRVC